MEQNPINTSSWSLQDFAKAIPALVIGISSACFILGLLIVNLRLAKYGVYSSEFIRTEYVMAGAVFILLIAIAGICISYFTQQMKVAGKYWAEKRYLQVIYIVLGNIALVIVTISSALMVLNLGQIYLAMKSLLVAVFAVLIIWLMISNLSIRFISIIKLIKLSEPKDTVKGYLQDLLVIFPGLLMGIALYANFTYPLISTAYGGGYRTLAILFPTPRGLEVCKALALPVQRNQTVGPIEVLTE